MAPAPSTLTARLSDWARSARTLGLRLVGPAERAYRRLRGRPELPPLWLRRHVGPLRHFETAARDMVAFLDRRDLVRPGDLVVDLGCGCGAMTAALAGRVGDGGRYLGVDVHGPSIRWCRERWGGEDRIRFERAAMPSPYGEETAGDVAGPHAGYRIPAATGSAGFVLAKSLFTHLLEEQAGQYLAEIHRLLAPGRLAVLTAFLFAEAPPAFPHGDGPVRWRLAARPQAAVAYHRPHFEALVAAAGLEVVEVVTGFWPGTDRPPTGQDILVLERPAG